MAGPMNALPSRVTIREVGPRDGLQSESPISVEDRARLISMLSRTGIPKIEAVSFVSPKAVPAMANPDEVWSRVERNPDVRYSALVPNRKGAEAALEAGGFHSLQAFIAASDGYNQSNVGKSVDASIKDVADVVSVARGEGVPVEVSISAAFSDPYDGDVDPDRVLGLAEKLLSIGAAGFSLGDTTGMATPTRVWVLLDVLRERLPEVPFNLHFHDTRGTAMANVLAALQAGCEEFDSSIGGIGGSPFAPGAGGNVSTEDLAFMLTDMGIETGISSVEELLGASRFLTDVLGHPLRSHVLEAGGRWYGHAPVKVD
ncbi:MAG TPA: hydroxymethylglutaryl-CoA lyase [Actinomycetota bacterium]|nr:hydroxymethylglutaryl-CoA lyase [Actinomycetota bacterium]